ncbi:Vegetative incompatibility protein HET-E-1 [Cladobotryum mycophilum]|uniref:Vegetative incompatibility protein HET-E-1 n=1 Tax=Cladobotryum mycophilum TaxID=491253 RepID=A0ABR0SJW6_9HYPO
MRLLRTSTLEIEEFGYGQIPAYAILSHRWGKYELTLQDVKDRIWTKEGFNHDISKLEAFKKVEQFCSRANADLFEHVWIDSCCIDKTSSAELSEAINSMYLWYYKAKICYAYLADVPSNSTFERSEWFKRGWTLQELLAPSEIHFLNEDWKNLGTKKSLQEVISGCTRIPVDILSGASLETASIAQRMSWASHRKTTRIEDRAYCLMGIFGVNMPLLYGEGERAFMRLQEEIMRVSNDHSLFAWKSPDIRGGLLATSPDAFSGSNNIVESNPLGSPSGPLTVSSRGIHLEIRFIGRGPRGLGMAILHCIERGREDRPLAIYVKDMTLTMERFDRVWSENLEGLDLSKFRTLQYPMRNICIRTARITPWAKVEDCGKQGSVMESIYSNDKLTSLMNFADPTEVFRVAQAGQQDVVWLLLTRSDIKANLKDKDGRTVLWHAVTCCREVLVKILLAQRDIDVEVQDKYGRTPLWCAASHGHDAIVKLLLERGVDIEAQDKYGQTPLWQAAHSGREAIVKLLLEKGADIEAQDNDSQTPLQQAAYFGHEAIVKLLLEKGADIEAQDKDSRTPLWRAASRGRETIVKLLLEKGANIKAQDKYGQTPLHQAAYSSHKAIVKLLLKNGADIKAQDQYNRTPLQQAIYYGHHTIAKLLQ